VSSLPSLSQLRARASEAASASPEWHYQGVVLPRGGIVSGVLSESELCELEARAQLRRAAALDRCSVSRPSLSASVLSALCEWCSAHGLNAMGTVTFSDSYASARGIYSLSRALSDVDSGFSQEVPLRGSHGVKTRYVLSGEWHRTGREVPHVHLAFETAGNPETFLSALDLFFSSTRGRCRFELMRDSNVATLYGLKDVLKEGSGSLGEGVRLRLSQGHMRHRRRSHSSSFRLPFSSYPNNPSPSLPDLEPAALGVGRCDSGRTGSDGALPDTEAIT